MRPKKQLFITLLLGILVLSSCKQYDMNRDNEAPLATVGQNSLYPSDIPLYFSSSLSPEDSTQMIRNYIKQWVTHELIVELAEKNLSNETQKQILKQVIQTKNELYIYHYEQAMILQRMDTIVADTTLQRFYNTHKDIFHLDNNIVKALFIQIPLSVPNISNVRRWYRSDDPNDFNNLEGFCFQFATKFDDFDERWVSFDNILENLPYPVSNQERLLRTNRFIEAKDSLYQYYVRINEYALVGSEAPLEYVANDIKNTILNERKITFLQELENNIYSNALNKNEFVIY